MSRILLNTLILVELIKTKSIVLLKKYQKDAINYYIVPNISISLFNPTVTWIDPLKKHISFSFNKYECSSLYKLLQFINKVLTEAFIKYDDENIDKNVSPFYYEKGDTFYIRCFLPKSKSNYLITSQFENEPENTFHIPRVGSKYQSVIIDFRNIWQDFNSNAAGFHIELKHVHI